MEYNPIQTNQRPCREKLIQRLWEYVRGVVFGLSPWFARKWRVAWLYVFSSLYRRIGGGGLYLLELFDCPYGTYRLSMEFRHWGTIFRWRTLMGVLSGQDYDWKELLHWRKCSVVDRFA